MSARLASSFSRNGISDAATLTSCLGETSIYSTSSGVSHDELAAFCRAEIRAFVKLPFVIDGGIGLGDDMFFLIQAVRNSILLGDPPFSTLR